MPWYGYSILTSFSLVGLYLCIKWLTARGFETKQILLFMIGFALLGFLGATVPDLQRIANSEHLLGFLAAGTFAGIFAAIGHWADFEALKRAPNPGYATAIRNSSILPVTVFSIFLFGSSFHFVKLAGALLILIGIVVLVVERNGVSGQNGVGHSAQKKWVVLALIALIGYTLMVLGVKKATLLGFAPPEICLCIYIVNFVFFTVVCRKNLKEYFQDKIKLNAFLPAVFICSVFAFAANLLNVKGLELAPNPGYSEAVRNTNVLFITLLAIPLFKASFDRRKMAGVVTIVVGIFVLVI